MLINKVELPLPGNRPQRDTIKAYIPQLEALRKLFASLYAHHSEPQDDLDKVERADETACSRFAASDTSTPIITKLLPNLRCSA